ncbi:MAG: hypothetical protein ETSY2_53490, partial [Candidatus Entotheonella gemina]
LTSPSPTTYDKRRHLLASDISVDSHHEPSTVAIRVKASKTDQFGQGVTIYLGVTKNELCPVTALLQYLTIRPGGDGPLFIAKEGKFLTKPGLVQKVREALTAAGIDSSHYSGHSFRIGAATTAAACGVSDSLIKTLGRWSSSAFQSYIKIPSIHLAQASSVLAPQRTAVSTHQHLQPCNTNISNCTQT